MVRLGVRLAVRSGREALVRLAVITAAVGIGVGLYGFNFAQGVRVDPQDNIWVVDQGSTQVIKFDPDGRVLLVLSRAFFRAGLRRYSGASA